MLYLQKILSIQKDLIFFERGYSMSKPNALRNTNRGFLLTAAILIAVVTFLLLQGKADDKLEPELKAMATDFIADSDKVIILPEEFRLSAGDVESSSGTYELIERYVDNVSEDNKFYSQNEALRKYSLDWLQQALLVQGYVKLYDSSKTEIKQFNSFSVYKDTATLSFDVEFEYKINVSNGPVLSNTGIYTDTLTFEKEDGNWIITNYQTGRYWTDLNNMGGEY